jgi:hypothetical protein
VKPFNLEQALAGKPVVTRNGREVIHLQQFPIKGTYPLIGLVQGNSEVSAWRIDGTISPYGASVDDLVMPVTKKTLWLNVYPCKMKTTFTPTGYRAGGPLYPSEADAKKAAAGDAVTVAIEIEE